MVTSSSSSDYDYYYSSISSEEDSKTFASKDRSNMDQSSKNAKKVMNGIHLNHSKATHDNFLKRRDEDEMLVDYRQERERFQRMKLAAEEKLRSHDDGLDSDSDASEYEPVWVPRDRKINPDRRSREIERLVEDDLEDEHEKEVYWDMMYSDPDERPDFINCSNNDSEGESDEDSSKYNNDDESDNSDKSDDESDASED